MDFMKSLCNCGIDLHRMLEFVMATVLIFTVFGLRCVDPHAETEYVLGTLHSVIHSRPRPGPLCMNPKYTGSLIEIIYSHLLDIHLTIGHTDSYVL